MPRIKKPKMKRFAGDPNYDDRFAGDPNYDDRFAGDPNYDDGLLARYYGEYRTARGRVKRPYIVSDTVGYGPVGVLGLLHSEKRRHFPVIAVRAPSDDSPDSGLIREDAV